LRQLHVANFPAHKNGWTKATRLCCDDYVSCWFWLAPLVAVWLLLAVGLAVAFNAWLFFPSARVALRRQPAWFRALRVVLVPVWAALLLWIWLLAFGVVRAGLSGQWC